MPVKPKSIISVNSSVLSTHSVSVINSKNITVLRHCLRVA